MTPRPDADARIAAFFETSQPELPDRAFEAVRRDIHRTRQRVVIGPWRPPAMFALARYCIAAALVVLLGILLVDFRPGFGPGGQPTPSPTPPITAPPSVAPSATPSAPAGPTVFTSPLYDYTITIPTGWIAAPAVVRWDGTKAPGPDAESDKFVGPGRLSAWAIAGPFVGDLEAFTADRIAANARDHSDTCPPDAFQVKEPFRIGDQPWVFLGWNCGALINEAITIRGGIAFAIVFRDLAVEAATDPADRAIFQSMLDAVELPN
jgi:hypothetical protein